MQLIIKRTPYPPGQLPAARRHDSCWTARNRDALRAEDLESGRNDFTGEFVGHFARCCGCHHLLAEEAKSFDKRMIHALHHRLHI